MTVYLDEPLPDEILFSVIARYVENSRIKNTSEFLSDLIGGSRSEHDEFEKLARQTSRAWGIPAREIRRQLTLAPFYAALFPGEAQTDLMKRLRSTSWSGYVISGKPGVRYCDACWLEDDRNDYPRYWRRRHQIVGVVVCPQHRCALSSSGPTFARTLLNTAARRDGGNAVVVGSKREREEWRKIAILASQFLFGDAGRSEYATKGLRIEMAGRCGYVAGCKVDSARMAKDLTARLGEGYFLSVGCSRDVSQQLRRALLVPDDRAGSPLYTLLLCYLLIDVGTRSAINGTPDCPCSHPHCDDSHNVIQWASREGLPHYFCICGISFIHDPHEQGAGVRLTQEGPDIALAAAMLMDRSFSIKKLVSMLGLSTRSFEEITRRRIEISWWRRRTQRAAKLVQWIELVDRSGGPDKAYAVGAHVFHAIGRLNEVLPETAIPKNARTFGRERLVRGER